MGEKKPRVLLVEDDRVFAELVMKRFAARSVDIVHCGSGKETLDMLEKDGNFTVILLDISLPDIDGLEVLSRIEQVPPLAAIPVVIVSNFTVEQDAAWAAKHGVRKVIKKISVMPEEIVDIALAESKS